MRHQSLLVHISEVYIALYALDRFPCTYQTTIFYFVLTCQDIGYTYRHVIALYTFVKIHFKLLRLSLKPKLVVLALVS